MSLSRQAIGAVYDHPHGVCCAVTLPLIMDHNREVSQEKYARLAGAFGIDGHGLSQADLASQAIQFVRGLNSELGIPTLPELIREADLDVLAEKANANTSRPSNPRDVDEAGFRAMFAQALSA